MPFVSSVNRTQSTTSSPSVPKRREFPTRPRLKIPLPHVAHQLHFPTMAHHHHHPAAPRGPYASPAGLPKYIHGQTPTTVPLTPTSHTGIPTIVYPSDKPHDGFVLTQLKDLQNWTKSGLSIGEKCVLWLYGKVSSWSKRWFTHIFLCLILLAYTVVGAFLFISIEGNVKIVQQDIRKESARNREIYLQSQTRVASKRKFNKARQDEMIRKIRDLWDERGLSSDEDAEDEWNSRVRGQILLYEERLYGMLKKLNFQTHPEDMNWVFWNGVIYCCTIYTTIGYGHISPSTSTGRALTIVYAIFGIPMFLIVLADFGKLFTRGIKFLWAFVRRLYYTGSCRKVRRTVHMQEMMKGVQLVYDWSTSFRRPSQMTDEEIVEMERHRQQQQQQQQQQQHPHHTSLSVDGNTPQQTPESPSTPDMSAFEIDDEFNLPISVAITILVLYIIIGAVIFNIFEDWTFFESFYFVFISMSTIGFGDFVPQDPLYMMLSIVYLIFGLALTSMCINVVQVKLADQFKQASQKIGLAIGVHVAEEEARSSPCHPSE
ncbi:unnamed protein product [Trichogramma brassicae]|uniref:Potassium channel domain-containing protein n=1 Tax=Trichogramma brassicae TaxID=86971 RepID=A0A6H5ILW8_9HYME|nr:unnamed protein product [Trichogramma brassicae]